MSFFAAQGKSLPGEGKICSPVDSIPETVLYTMNVHFLEAKVTKTRYTLTGALLATLAGMAASVIVSTTTDYTAVKRRFIIAELFALTPSYFELQNMPKMPNLRHPLQNLHLVQYTICGSVFEK